jgi:hypothetical protein
MAINGNICNRIINHSITFFKNQNFKFLTVKVICNDSYTSFLLSTCSTTHSIIKKATTINFICIFEVVEAVFFDLITVSTSSEVHKSEFIRKHSNISKLSGSICFLLSVIISLALLNNRSTTFAHQLVLHNRKRLISHNNPLHPFVHVNCFRIHFLTKNCVRSAPSCFYAST